MHTSSSPRDDRRTMFRLRCSVPFDLHRSGSRPLPLTTTELSGSGMICHTDHPVAVGERVTAVLRLGGEELRAVRGQVVRCATAGGLRGGTHELAVEFEHRRGTDTEKRIVGYVLDRQRARLRSRDLVA